MVPGAVGSEHVKTEVGRGSRQTECAWLAPRWVLSHSMSSRGPWTR